MAGEFTLPEFIIEKYKANLKEIEDQMAGFIQQEATPPDLVRSYFQTKMIIEKKTRNFAVEDELTILDQLEAWYIDKGLQFPNPAWLEGRRKAFKEKQSQS